MDQFLSSCIVALFLSSPLLANSSDPVTSKLREAFNAAHKPTVIELQAVKRWSLLRHFVEPIRWERDISRDSPGGWREIQISDDNLMFSFLKAGPLVEVLLYNWDISSDFKWVFLPELQLTLNDAQPEWILEGSNFWPYRPGSGLFPNLGTAAIRMTDDKDLIIESRFPKNADGKCDSMVSYTYQNLHSTEWFFYRTSLTSATDSSMCVYAYIVAKT